MPGLLRGVARTAVVAGTATAVSGRVSRRQQGRWAQQEQEQAPERDQPQQQQQEAAAAAPAGNDMDSKLAQLKDLGELKAQGVLSEAEFEVQKNKILNS